MAFPTICHCLICEDVRPEVRGKFTILGLYGVAPDVQIRLKELGKRIERLSFQLLGTTPDETRKYLVKPEVVGPDGEVIQPPKDAPGFEFEVKKAEAGQFALSLTLPQVLFTREGTHAFVLKVDGEEHYRAEFSVAQGMPGEFG